MPTTEAPCHWKSCPLDAEVDVLQYEGEKTPEHFTFCLAHADAFEVSASLLIDAPKLVRLNL